MSECKLCKERGKPEYFGSEPKCAWEMTDFSSDNWNCATANALRDLIDYNFRDDMFSGSIGVIHIPENDIVQGYVVMSWYKERGRTAQIWLFNDDDMPRPLLLKEAEEIVKIK